MLDNPGLMGRKALVQVSLFFVFLVGADQGTKYLAAQMVSPASPVAVLPFFQLVNVRNTGAAFGLFRTLGNGFFIALSFLAIAFIVYLIVQGKESRTGLVLVLSGAVGNLIDRIFFSYVRDFLDFHAGGYHWPAFNVADSCLSVGIVFLLFGQLFTSLLQKTTSKN